MDRIFFAMGFGAWLLGILLAHFFGVSNPFLEPISTPLQYILFGSACVALSMLFYGRLSIPVSFALGITAYPFIAFNALQGLGLYVPLEWMALVGGFMGKTLNDEMEYGQSLDTAWNRIPLYLVAGMILMALGWYFQGV